MNEQAFKEVLSEIIEEFLPEEKLSFDLGGDEVIHQVYETGGVKSSNVKGDINFLEQGKSVLEFIALIVSTYKLVKDFYKSFKAKKDTEAIASTWKDLLIKEGIDAQKADEITKKYTNSLLQKTEAK